MVDIQAAREGGLSPQIRGPRRATSRYYRPSRNTVVHIRSHQKGTDRYNPLYRFNAAVIATGDIFSTTGYRAIDVKNGGSIQGEIAALNHILDRTVYQHDEEGGSLIIPGRGRLCDEWELAEYRDMLVIIRDRVQDLIKNGATLVKVEAARVTADYDDRFGATSGLGDHGHVR